MASGCSYSNIHRARDHFNQALIVQGVEPFLKFIQSPARLFELGALLGHSIAVIALFGQRSQQIKVTLSKNIKAGHSVPRGVHGVW